MCLTHLTNTLSIFDTIMAGTMSKISQICPCKKWQKVKIRSIVKAKAKQKTKQRNTLPKISKIHIRKIHFRKIQIKKYTFENYVF